MIEIQCSSKLLTEKKYIIDVIFTEFIGLPYQLITDEFVSGFVIILANGNRIILNASFWETVDDSYLNEKFLPTVIMVNNHFTPENDIPLLFGLPDIGICEDEIICGNDIFGACFFMLSRMEEAIIQTRDGHDRFPAIASIAYNSGFLDRPIVDEYVEMLWNMLSSLDGNLTRNLEAAKTFVTCDVDWPFKPARQTFKAVLKRSLGELIKRRQVKDSLVIWKYYLYHFLNIKQSDYNREKIDFIMNENEKVGNKVAFYFITEYTSKYDSNFNFGAIEMRRLFRDIHSRGHEIGLHPGYNCFDNPTNFKLSANTLKRVLKEENISQSVIGGRMHYLRWDITKTPQLWEKYGFDYDSTLSFADKSGFRCGTSREFTMFDLVGRKALKLKQRPLINMECTVISSDYESLGYSEHALERFIYFKNVSHKYSGSYTLLWHNTHFGTVMDDYFYTQLIK